MWWWYPPLVYYGKIGGDKMYNEDSCDTPCKEIETIEQTVKQLSAQVFDMVKRFNAIIDKRILAQGEPYCNTTTTPKEPVSCNKIDRIIQDLVCISNRINDFRNIRLESLDKELAKL